MLLEYIEARKQAEKKEKTGSGAARGKGEGILQYQIGMSNASYSTRPDSFSPLMNALPNLSKLGGTNFLLANEQFFQESKPFGINFQPSVPDLLFTEFKDPFVRFRRHWRSSPRGESNKKRGQACEV